MLQKRTGMGEMWAKAVELHHQEGAPTEAYGPVKVLLEIGEWLGWQIDENLVAKRERGGSISVVDGDDSLSFHVLRQDLRRAGLEERLHGSSIHDAAGALQGGVRQHPGRGD